MYWVVSIILFKKKPTFQLFVSIKSRNHIHFYLTVCLNHTEQKIGTIYSLENLESYIYRVCEDNETIMKRIEQLLSPKIEFVSLTRVSQRLVNDCNSFPDCAAMLGSCWCSPGHHRKSWVHPMSSSKRIACIILISIAIDFFGGASAGRVSENEDSERRLRGAVVYEFTIQ